MMSRQKRRDFSTSGTCRVTQVSSFTARQCSLKRAVVEFVPPLMASEMAMKVVIGGANGLIGSELARTLRARGEEVVALVRKPRDPGDVKWDGRSLPPGTLERADAAVNLSGANIGARRWSEAYKKEIVDSRVESTRAFVDAMRSGRAKPRVFVNASAVGAYGGRGDEELTEESTRGGDFLAGVCKESELEALRADEVGVRTVLLRTGVVLRLGLGEMAEVLLEGQRALPSKALDGGYRFRFPELKGALADLLGAPARTA